MGASCRTDTDYSSMDTVYGLSECYLKNKKGNRSGYLIRYGLLSIPVYLW